MTAECSSRSTDLCNCRLCWTKPCEIPAPPTMNNLAALSVQRDQGRIMSCCRRPPKWHLQWIVLKGLHDSSQKSSDSLFFFLWACVCVRLLVALDPFPSEVPVFLCVSVSDPGLALGSICNMTPFARFHIILACGWSVNWKLKIEKSRHLNQTSNQLSVMFL